MGKDSKIEWTDHTFNPWVGCRAVSPACDHCYAEAWAKRAGRDFAERRLTADANWKQPLKWNREAAEAGVRKRVFCASLADVFDAEVPDDWRDRLFALIALTPHLDWLLLTKRPKVARDYLSSPVRQAPEGFHDPRNTRRHSVYATLSGSGSEPTASGGFGLDAARVAACMDGLFSGGWPLPNVWLGTTVETQTMAEARIPHLLDAPAARRFLSCEPLLGPVDLTAIYGRMGTVFQEDVLSGRRYHHDDGGQWTPGGRVDWVIAGGESGPGARPMHPDWARALRDQCAGAGVPFLFKQWGEWAQSPDYADDRMDYVPNDGRLLIGDPALSVVPMRRVGKKHAGRLLDGRLHDAVPSPAVPGHPVHPQPREAIR